MPWYKLGTVSITNGSNAVIGSGTSFIANCRVGDAFRGPDGGWYEVTNVASNTALSISPNYQGATNAAGAYALAPMQGYVKDSADALRSFVNTYGPALAAIKPWAIAVTPAAARDALGLGTAATLNTGTTTGAVALNGQVMRPLSLELGQATSAAVTYLDAHSSGQDIDYDFRTLFSGGGGAVGQGACTFTGLSCSFVMGGTEHLGISNNHVRFGTDQINPVGQGAYGSVINRGGQLSIMGVDNNNTIQLGKKTTTGSFLHFYRYVDGAGASTIGSISRTESAVAYNTTSDYRLKENVVRITHATEQIVSISWVQWQWIGDNDRTYYPGVLAHQLQPICPEAVVGEKDAVDEDGNIIPQQVDYSKLVPKLGASLTEQVFRIDDLETEVQSLRLLVESLAARIAVLEA